MNEHQLIELLTQAEQVHEDAKANLAKAKRAWVEAETAVIDAAIQKARLREQLRVYRETTPNYIPDARENEIEGFRERNPELVEFARERDKTKGE